MKLFSVVSLINQNMFLVCDDDKYRALRQVKIRLNQQKENTHCDTPGDESAWAVTEIHNNIDFAKKPWIKVNAFNTRLSIKIYCGVIAEISMDTNPS